MNAVAREFNLDDLDQDPMASTALARNANEDEIRRGAHIANGGELATVDCPKCRGTGFWRAGYPCFTCKGKGKATKRQVGAMKAKVTREENLRAKIDVFIEDHPQEAEFLRKASEWSEFYRSMIENLHKWGSLTDNQMAAVRNGMAKQAARRAEKQAQREAKGGAVDVTAIEALFATARESGLKKLAFRTMHIDISAPKDTGRNPGALYVKHDGEYVGKIAGGRFLPVYAAKSDTLDKVLEVAADPLGMAKFYGRQTGNCSCCGRELTDPVSVEAGIGPICASKWGL